MISTFPGYFSDPGKKERAKKIVNGTYPYGVDPDYGVEKNGGLVEYWDGNQYWTTSHGNQSGSSFVLSDVKDNNDGTSMKIATFTFNCTLYNRSAQTIKVTNGRSVGKIVIPY
ncbi:MAG: hypothetical protein RIE58_00020 [Vicingaceae bacterium]